jgi:two-component system CheB/CheR fusion protein
MASMKMRNTPRSDKKEPATSATDATAARPQNTPFPIIGIGASAGGLEALERFLRNVPEASGMALVIVQHLDPTHKGVMPELLQRATPMRVIQVKDRTKVQPNCVYVIPPNKDMSILHGILHLLDPGTPRGLRLPIDFFFRSLAQDQQERSVGVILSGMGSDGTLGLKAIKEKAGVVFVQDPDSAKFDGMPRSAIDAGLGDVVALVEELPAQIIAVLHHLPPLLKPAPTLESKTLSAIDKICILLRTQTGHDFSLYKSSTIHRRIERRMGVHQIGKIADYVRFLQENPHELELLFKELLIGVTSFFRDPAAWEQLKTEALPALLAGHPPEQPLRAWTPGCSTGEEAYSLAMVFKEAAQNVKPARKYMLQIFATDVDPEAIAKARQGSYPANIAADVSPERLKRFFVKDEHGYRISKEIREMVVFAPQNLIMDPPFTKLDILICRNLLIYLVPELQKKILPLFHYSLKPGGVLFLGSAESIGTFTDLFATLPGKSRLYRRLESSLRSEPLELPKSFAPVPPSPPERSKGDRPAPNLQTMAEQLLLQQFSPAAVLVNNQGDILFVSGRTGKYLEPAAGKANWNIFVMLREGLRHEVGSAFAMVLRQKRPHKLSNLKVGTNGGTQFLDVTLQAIDAPEALRGMVMVVFTDVAMPPETPAPGKKVRTGSNIQAVHAQQELQQAREEIQTLREEMQTSQEELKSSNEELQSTNEELQSTNEELTTSKEEMQSMNEELQTVNNEQQAKVDELSRASSDLKTLLNATDIATLFLDKDLHLRRFTTPTTKIIPLLPADAGRPITNLASDLNYPELAADAREVLRTLVPIAKEVSASNNRWFAARIVPYRTLEDVIDGVAITFVDITETQRAREALRKANDLLRLAVVVRDAHDAITVQDLDGRILAWNPGAVRMYGWSEAEALMMNIRDTIPEELRKDALAKVQRLGMAEVLAPYPTQRLTKQGEIIEIWMTATALLNEAGQMYAIATTERVRDPKTGPKMEAPP